MSGSPSVCRWAPSSWHRHEWIPLAVCQILSYSSSSPYLNFWYQLHCSSLYGLSSVRIHLNLCWWCFLLSSLLGCQRVTDLVPSDGILQMWSIFVQNRSISPLMVALTFRSGLSVQNGNIMMFLKLINGPCLSEYTEDNAEIRVSTWRRNLLNDKKFQWVVKIDSDCI